MAGVSISLCKWEAWYWQHKIAYLCDVLVNIEQPALGGETESWLEAFSDFHGVHTDVRTYFKIPTCQWALLEKVVKDSQ